MATIFMMNKEIARGMVCFFHQKKHSYLILQFVIDTIICILELQNQKIENSGEFQAYCGLTKIYIYCFTTIYQIYTGTLLSYVRKFWPKRFHNIDPRKMTFAHLAGLTAQDAATILGVSKEMVEAHNPKIAQPMVSHFIF
jgi:hypothetical protein